MHLIYQRVSFRWPVFFLGVLGAIPTVQAAEVQYPLSIAVAESGDMYLADRNLPGVWKLQGDQLTLFYEGSRKFRTPLNAIRCVAIDRDGKLLAGDSSTRDVYRFNDRGEPIGLTQKPLATDPAKPAATPPAAEDSKTKNEAKAADQKNDSKKANPEPSPASSNAKSAPSKPRFVFGQIGIPMDIAVDKNGDLFVSDLEIHRIVRVPKGEDEVKEFAQVQAPHGLCFDAAGNLWVISGRRLVRISPAGEKSVVVEEGVFEFPHTVAVSPDNTAYVCDGYAKTIWKVPAGGKPEKLVSGEPLVNPVGMRLASDKLCVVDPRAKAVFQITLDGKITSIPLKAN